jgi:hypothetical protein
VGGRVAFHEPLLPAPILAKQARRLRYEAQMAERHGGGGAERLYRAAIERFVDAFLVNREGHAECFAEAHRMGRHVQETFGCPMTPNEKGTDWSVDCGVLALHQRLGLSFAGTSLGRCSICGAGDLECDHVAGNWYAGRHCHREVYKVDLHEVSIVQFPHDPRCYRLQALRSVQEVERARGRPLVAGEVPLCTHCAGCDGADRGAREEDIDQSLWPPLTPTTVGE